MKIYLTQRRKDARFIYRLTQIDTDSGEQTNAPLPNTQHPTPRLTKSLLLALCLCVSSVAGGGILAGCTRGGSKTGYLITPEDQKKMAKAIKEDVPRKVEDLIVEGVSPDSVDEHGVPYLVVCAETGKTDIIRPMLMAKADPNIATKEGRTALIAASENGYHDTVRTLLDNGAVADLTYKTGEHAGQTALMFAAAKGQTDIVGTLLEKGAKPNAVDAKGRSPLMFAVRSGQDLTVSALLKAKADPNLHALDGSTPLKIATEHHFSNLIPLLKDAGAKE